MKKEKKQLDWEKKKAEMKAAGEWKNKPKKKTKGALAHLIRFNELSGKDADGNDRKLTKEEKKRLFTELVLKGPKIVIDCDFESYMRENEIKSMN